MSRVSGSRPLLLSFLVVLALVLVIAGWRVLRFGSWGAEVLDWPSGRWSDVLDCSDEIAWVVSTSKQSREAYIARVARGGTRIEAQVGVGHVVSLSVSPDQSAWAVLKAGTPNANQILRSVDSGKHWAPMNSPGGVIGAVPVSANEGFAWSDRALFWTLDSGRNWAGVEMRGEELRQGNEAGRAMLTRSGSLLVATQRHTVARSRARVLLVDLGGRVREVGAWDDASVFGLAEPLPGMVVVSVRADVGPGSRARIIRLDTATREATELDRLDGSVHLQGRDGVLLVDLAGEDGPGSFLSSWQRQLLTSADLGRTWSRRDISGAGIGSTCLAPGGYWTVSDNRQAVEYRPVGR